MIIRVLFLRDADNIIRPSRATYKFSPVIQRLVGHDTHLLVLLGGDASVSVGLLGGDACVSVGSLIGDASVSVVLFR